MLGNWAETSKPELAGLITIINESKHLNRVSGLPKIHKPKIRAISSNLNAPTHKLAAWLNSIASLNPPTYLGKLI